MKETERIQRLELPAQCGRLHDQTWAAFFRQHVQEITAIVRRSPAGWGSVRDRLLSILTGGTADGFLAAGDGGKATRSGSRAR
jgi:hypothetical protein